MRFNITKILLEKKKFEAKQTKNEKKYSWQTP